jgi:hypothetical protein
VKSLHPAAARVIPTRFLTALAGLLGGTSPWNMLTGGLIIPQ